MGLYIAVIHDGIRYQYLSRGVLKVHQDNATIYSSPSAARNALVKFIDKTLRENGEINFRACIGLAPERK